jgi:uncharacterized protein (DUF488 family)
VAPRTAYTIGYEGADRAELIATLNTAGVTLVVDTRKVPTSRRAPYRKQALAAALAEAGIGYVSMPALGVDKALRHLAKKEPIRFGAAYRRTLRKADLELNELVRTARRFVLALLCFEFDERQCHRLHLSLALAGRSTLRFSHLRVRGSDYPDDHPAAP